ncbi:MAG: hypothetical protein IT384_16205 [Deltaproteobacteria bacterium]|nr:hypothetical protein [Deltaproteobacteria bacterium]
MKARIWMTAALSVVVACETGDKTTGERAKDPKTAAPLTTPGKEDVDAPGKRVVQPIVAAEKAPAASPRLAALPSEEQLKKAAQSYFEGHVGHRIYVQVDKPLYKPGESIWIKTWDLRLKDLAGHQAGQQRYDLVSPRGSVVMSKNVQVERGAASNDFVLPEEIEGGEYTLRVTSVDGVTEERPLIVSVYQAPRFKKKLEFVRKAYGAGDEVTATIKVERPTGEAFANQTLRGNIWLDGETLEPVKLTTNAEGGGVVRFKLPSRIEKGDGLLTVLVDDGGITESVSKRIPIIVKKLQFSFFPEGGALVTGVPSRLYFEAKNPIGKPADIEGRIVDDHGNPVATFTSYHDGLGRFDFTPGTGRTYSAEITKPAGVTEKYPLPLANEQGCVLRAYDDLDSQIAAIRVGVRCAPAKKVVVAAMLRENLLDAASLDVPEGSEVVAYLEAKDEALKRAQGTARVTLFDENLQPLAERLVYRNRRSQIAVKITPDRKAYSPREQVALTIETSDDKGAPVAAELAVSVVDDTVVSFADDKTGHLLSRMFLEQEIPGKVEEPKPYFDLTEPKSALAMDLLMGTRGWRRFEWATVLAPPPPRPTEIGTGGGGAMPEDAMAGDELADKVKGEGAIGGLPRDGRGRDRPMARAAAPAAPAVAAPPPAPPAKPMMGAKAEAKRAAPGLMGKLDKDMEARRGPAAAPEPIEQAAPERQREKKKARLEVADNKMMEAEAVREIEEEPMMEVAAGRIAQQPISVARVFPAPVYRGDEPSTRTDFRETIHWVPSVLIGKSGRATITFYLSDAVTSFRIFAEGASGGMLGRAEETFKSSLPFSMDVKIPLEVSAGDKIQLPLTLTNDKDRELAVSLKTSFGELMKLDREVAFAGTLAASKRASMFYPLTVTGKSGKSPITFAADAGGLTDEFTREVNVVPLGFPQTLAQSGTLKGNAKHTFDLGQAIEGSSEVTLKLYPSPVATIVSGLEGMIREPGGCFEQTSSTNYPNVMVLDYLRSNDVADPALVERANGMLERGYKKLVGFETANKGYEWFGNTPAHEALTAYGLVEFVDMKRVTGSVDEEMLERTAKYLRSRRDGKGGFQRDAQALDSFGRASPEVTDAYIVWSLTEAGFFDFAPEIDRIASTAESTKDEYVLALATNTLLNVPAKKAQAMAALKRLAALQGNDGAWTHADHSITRSGGINLHIETTSLALIALMKAGGHEDQVRKGIQWIAANRGGFGEWGATQATVLALRAMTTYAKLSRRTPGSGTIVVKINGEEVGRRSYEAGHKDAIELTGLGRFLKANANEIELVHDGKADLPYSIGIEFRSLKPATAPDVVVDLSTKLEKNVLKMGDTVRLTAVVKNKTADGQPMTLARIGLPGGLTFQNWQLKELREKGTIAFFETRAREVILYFRELKPSETKEIGIDLVATVPGQYTGPASSAYLYYTNDKRVWVDPLEATITAAGAQP